MRRTITPKKLAILKRRHEVENLYLQGLPQHSIAAKYDVDRAQISRDLKWMQQQWMANSLTQISIAKAKELAKIDLLEREAWQAWERSKEDAERRKATQRGDMRIAEQTTEGQCGDPRFMQQVERCIKLRLAILGINTEATKHEHTGPSGGEIPLRIISYGDAEPGKPFKEVTEVDVETA